MVTVAHCKAHSINKKQNHVKVILINVRFIMKKLLLLFVSYSLSSLILFPMENDLNIPPAKKPKTISDQWPGKQCLEEREIQQALLSLSSPNTQTSKEEIVINSPALEHNSTYTHKSFRLDKKSRIKIRPVIYIHYSLASHIYTLQGSYFYCPYPGCTHKMKYQQSDNNQKKDPIKNYIKKMKKHLLKKHLYKDIQKNSYIGDAYNKIIKYTYTPQTCPIENCNYSNTIFSSKANLLLHIESHIVFTNETPDITHNENKDIQLLALLKDPHPLNQSSTADDNTSFSSKNLGGSFDETTSEEIDLTTIDKTKHCSPYIIISVPYAKAQIGFDEKGIMHCYCPKPSCVKKVETKYIHNAKKALITHMIQDHYVHKIQNNQEDIDQQALQELINKYAQRGYYSCPVKNCAPRYTKQTQPTFSNHQEGWRHLSSHIIFDNLTENVPNTAAKIQELENITVKPVKKV